MLERPNDLGEFILVINSVFHSSNMALREQQAYNTCDTQ
jgi:hypothetical protein